MDIIVRKYGGTSLAEPDLVRRAADQLIELHAGGEQVVAVASAIGDLTERLLLQAGQLAAAPRHRELDLLLSSGERVAAALLAIAIQSRGVPAVALTGHQAGIRTDGQYLEARIIDIDTTRIERELGAGSIVIVAGYQGMGPDRELTTLGRGGSDLTAVALATALGAPRCELLSDVQGIHTGDPVVVPTARPLSHLSWETAEAMARMGATVIQPRAAEHARRHQVPIHAAAAFDPATGTRIDAGPQAEAVEQAWVTAVAGRAGLVRLHGASERIAALRGRLPPHHVLFDGASHLDGSRELIVAPEPALSAVDLEGAFTSATVDDVSLDLEIGIVGLIGPFGEAAHSAVDDLRQVLTAARIEPLQAFVRADTLGAVVHAADVDPAQHALHVVFIEQDGRQLTR